MQYLIKLLFWHRDFRITIVCKDDSPIQPFSFSNYPDGSASCKEDGTIRKSFCIFDPDHLDEPACCKDEGTKSAVFDVAPKSNCCSALKRIFTCCV